jgi:hypothetical protein
VPRLTQGATPNYKDPPDRWDEPDDHAIGRSRGGLTTKTHAIVAGKGRPLVVLSDAARIARLIVGAEGRPGPGPDPT